MRKRAGQRSLGASVGKGEGVEAYASLWVEDAAKARLRFPTTKKRARVCRGS